MGRAAASAYGRRARTGAPCSPSRSGAGLAYARDGGRAGVVMIGGERTFRRNMKLMTENYVWKAGNGVVTRRRVRSFGERLSADLAVGVPFGVESFVAFPVVNFVYLF